MIENAVIYRNGRCEDAPKQLDPATQLAKEPGNFLWLDFSEPTADEIHDIADRFGLHPLAVEDALNARQRPKAELYDDTWFVVVKATHYIEQTETLEMGEILLFVGEYFVISVRHGAGAKADLPKIINGRSDLLALGPGAVLHAVLDHVVDMYSEAARELSVDVEEVETDVFSGARGAWTQRIYNIERKLLALNSAVDPLAPAVEELGKDRRSWIADELDEYYRDVLDHTRRVASQVATLRELASSVLQANLTQVSIQQNEDMRTISAWVAIAAVPTMLAGIYGMNFDHMPELHLYYGYPILLGVMATICGALYWRFKRANWL